MAEVRVDEYGASHSSGIHITGRILLNMWRILRGEIKLNIYTFESCVAALLHLRVPHITSQQLTQWFSSGPGGKTRTRTLHECFHHLQARDAGKSLPITSSQLQLASFGIEMCRNVHIS